MRIGIDGSNISSGGGVTHLYEILNALDLEQAGIKSIEVWSNKEMLSKIKPKEGVALKTHQDLEGGQAKRFYWQRKKLNDIARERYDILYVPGGSYPGNFKPFVTMNRNLQPFDDETRRRYKLSFQKLRLFLLEKIQAYTYRRAGGVIFLSDEAKRLTLNKIGIDLPNVITVPHGISPKFFKEPEKQYELKKYSFKKPFTILYASRINVYKHQWNVVEAIYNLRKEGYPVVLELVGNIENKQTEKLLENALKKYDPERNFVKHRGGRITQDELLNYYHKANAFVFASSCETFGQILLEAMASGLPIACSNRSAMPEILKDNGVYFDPENPAEITESLRTLLDSNDLRKRLSVSAYQEAHTYSWKKCAKNTFDFIGEVYENYS